MTRSLTADRGPARTKASSAAHVPDGRGCSHPRILELDALRGLAAAAVVAYHFTTRYDQLFGHASSLKWEASAGYFGVDLFFMLSGFVILMTLERTSGIWSFVWGRATRLYPAYWAAAGVTFVVVSWFGLPGQETTWREALLNVTMVQTLLGARHIDGAYWSLQAELLFYANMLVLHRCGALRNPAAAVLGWLTAAGAAAALQPWAASRVPLAAEAISKFQTLLSLKFIPLFAVGILLYDLRQRKAMSAGHVAGFTCVAAMVAAREGWQALSVDAGLALLLAAAVWGYLPWLAARPLVALGALSYTLYLIHQNVGYVVIRRLEASGASPTLAMLAATLVAIAAAWWLHRLVELPALHRLRSWEPRQLVRRAAKAPGETAR